MDIAADDLKQVFGPSFFKDISELVGNVTDIHDILTGNKPLNTPDKQKNIFHRFDDPITPSKQASQKQTSQTYPAEKKNDKDNNGIIGALTKVASTLIDVPKLDKKDTSLKAVYSSQAKELEQQEKFKILLQDVLNYELTSLYDIDLRPNWEKTNNTLEKIFHLLEGGFKGLGNNNAVPKKGIWDFLDNLLKDWLGLKAAGGALGILRRLLGIKEKSAANIKDEDRLASEEEGRIKEKSKAAIDDEKLINDEAKLNELRENALKKRVAAENLKESIAEADIEASKKGFEAIQKKNEYIDLEKNMVERGLIKDQEVQIAIQAAKEEAIHAEMESIKAREKYFELQDYKFELQSKATEAEIKASVAQTVKAPETTAKPNLPKSVEGAVGTEGAAAGESVSAISKFLKPLEPLITALKVGGKALGIVGAVAGVGENVYTSYEKLSKNKNLSTQQKYGTGTAALLGLPVDFITSTPELPFIISKLITDKKKDEESTLDFISRASKENWLRKNVYEPSGSEILNKGASAVIRDNLTDFLETINTNSSTGLNKPDTIADSSKEIKEAVIDRSEAQEEWLKKLSMSNDETAKNTRELINVIKDLKGEMNGPVINTVNNSSSIINTQGSTDGNALVRRKWNNNGWNPLGGY